ncbi:MAG: hypothetical protein KTR26_17480 [Flammeovirgaceae bacterium]|nr:hypothetical protein [Flammeovirgaceae bacterium]
MATPGIKPKKRNKKLEKSQEVETVVQTSNLEKAGNSKKKDINIKATEDEHREFKIYAASRDMTMHDLFWKMYDFYKANNP